jgi:ATP-dependent RNA helicase DHX8/PRP22
LKSLEQLILLGALTDDYKLSDPVGHQMARLPLDPMYSKALIMSSEFKCLEEMLIVVSMLSVESIFFCPREKLEEVSVFNYWQLFKFMSKGSKKLEVNSSLKF